MRDKETRPDLALIVSEKLAQAAGVFTTNLVKAAPVLVTMEHLKTGCRCNSGEQRKRKRMHRRNGIKHARIMAAETAYAWSISRETCWCRLRE